MFMFNSDLRTDAKPSIPAMTILRLKLSRVKLLVDIKMIIEYISIGYTVAFPNYINSGIRSMMDFAGDAGIKNNDLADIFWLLPTAFLRQVLMDLLVHKWPHAI